MRDIELIRRRVISCFEFGSNIPSLMDAVSQNARASKNHYDWASVQKRVVQVTETRSRKAKEIDIFANTNDLALYKQAVNRVTAQEQKAWMKLAYVGAKPEAMASFLNMWLLVEYLKEQGTLQERTVLKLKQLIPIVLSDFALHVRGQKPSRQWLCEIAIDINVSEKTWKNVWRQKYQDLTQLLVNLDSAALVACDEQYEKLFSKSA